ncbi:hypothetical protein BGI32_02980 [Snodgrassella alvi]|uniref:Uncharacterized protein n=1 Tax=Snodgrassella alvi TaxID=1196083 RepID=A0A2N9WVI5_9NEIS|nr:hypothetical protein BGI32_02980 [Snodgrassella alvi]
MAVAVYLMLFDTPAKSIVDIAITLAAACLFDAYFAQAVGGVVVVVLRSADALFGLSSAVLVVAVAVSSEMQELVTANQVVVAVVFSVFAVQQVGGRIVLQGFPVSLVTAAFDSAGVIIAVIGLSVFAVFFAYQSVEVVVLVAAFDEDIGQNRILIALYLFALQTAVAVVFELGVQASLGA